MTTTDELGSLTYLAGRPLDRRVLISNLASGGILLAITLVTGIWLAVIGAVYVAAASLFLAAVYARDTLSRKQEASAWAAPWLVAVLLWAWLLSFDESGTSGPGLLLWLGLVIATPCYLVWQLAAVAVRQLMDSDATTASEPPQ